MSPLDTVFGIAGPALLVGSIIGVFAFYGVCELVTRCRRGK